MRAAAAEAPLAPPLVAVSAPPPARPTLRAARGESRTVREEGSCLNPTPEPAPPRCEGEPSEPARKRRCGKWLTRDGCRKRGSQFGGLVPISRDKSLDPPSYACFNCLRLGHTMKHCPELWRGTVCYNCGRRGMTMRTCDRYGLAHRAYLAEKKKERLARNRAADTPAASSATASPRGPWRLEIRRRGRRGRPADPRARRPQCSQPQHHQEQPPQPPQHHLLRPRSQAPTHRDRPKRSAAAPA